jgi:hypothetical protein
MQASGDDKMAEGAFAGAFALLAVLIAVVGLVGVAQDKVQGIEYLAWKLEYFQWFMVALSVGAAFLALLSFSHMRGGWASIRLISVLVRVLIAGTVVATVGFAWLV